MINHNEKLLSNAIDFDQQSIDELEDYVTNLFKYMCSNNIKASHIYEKLLTQLSYKDLVWISTQYMIEKHDEIVKNKKELIDNLDEIFDDE